jgi:hypothetical protein
MPTPSPAPSRDGGLLSCRRSSAAAQRVASRARTTEMGGVRVPKPMRWGVVGAWATLAVFRPDAAAALLVAAVALVVGFALLGAYSRSLQQRRQPPPRICAALRTIVRYACAPRRVAWLGALACFSLLLSQLPSGWTDPPWMVADVYATRDHAAPGGAPPPEGPGLEHRRWDRIATAYEQAAGSQWGWEVGGGEASVRRAAAEWHAFLASVPPAPLSFGSNVSAAPTRGAIPGFNATAPARTRGIVMSAGGPYVEPAFISLYILRQMTLRGLTKETLPVEIWTSRLLDGVMAGQLRRKLEALPHVSVHYIEDRIGRDTTRRLLQLPASAATAAAGATSSGPAPSAKASRPFALKVLALLASSFDAALLLDADNIPAGDPAALFTSAAFEQNGAIFWPDFWRADEGLAGVTSGQATDASALRLILGYEEDAGLQTVESGQVVVDKNRSWTALLLTLFIILRADHYAAPMVSGSRAAPTAPALLAR